MLNVLFSLSRHGLILEISKIGKTEKRNITLLRMKKVRNKVILRKNVILLYYVLFSFVHFPMNLSLYRNNIRQIGGIPW